MGALDNRVAVITGAGRGLGPDAGAAEQVVAEIAAAGGEASADGHDVSDFEGAQRMIQAAVERYGRVDVLVNNAGILRDRFIVNMTEAEWDAVIRVHLRGHFCPLHHAAVHWRGRSKAGEDVKAAVVNTASPVGLTLPNLGQVNYATAKAGIAAMTQVAAAELGRYGVRVNAIAPGARTRMTLATPGLEEAMAQPDDPGAFDALDPGNVAPLVAYLVTADCSITGEVFSVRGGSVARLTGWTPDEPLLALDRRPTIDEIAQSLEGVRA